MVQGSPQLDVGPCTDVLEGCFKREGVWQLIRTMSPQVVMMDEISPVDIKEVEQYAHLGVKLCASAHGDDWERTAGRLGLYPWEPEGPQFDWYALLHERQIMAVLNREGQP